MAGNQEAEYVRLVKAGETEKANLAYEKYRASMEAAGQTPKSRQDILG